MKKDISALFAFALLVFSGCGRDNPIQGCPESAVDLGIVMTRENGSSYKLYWAKSNLSDSGLCSHQEDYGDYYAWGETETREQYFWKTYKWCNGGARNLTKYNTELSYGTVDNRTVLDPEDDVAHIKLGGKWRMPTDAEWTELRENCTWTRTTQNSVTGYKVTATNGNSIFLPGAGGWYGEILSDEGCALYWSSSLDTDVPYSAWSICRGPSPDYFFGSDDVHRYSGLRYFGFSIRPVYEE